MSRIVYLVRWLHDYYYLETAFRGGLPVVPSLPRVARAFTDPVAAAQFGTNMASGVAASSAAVNPFLGLRKRWIEDQTITGLADLTSMPEPIFLDWVRDAGLEPPAATPHGRTRERDWAGWWEQHALNMTEHQRAKVWQALDRLRFYEIVETELED